jgi:hypothetical protein
MILKNFLLLKGFIFQYHWIPIILACLLYNMFIFDDDIAQDQRHGRGERITPSV